MLQVGTGPFQWMVLIVCGLANAADAVEILSVGLIGTAAEQDLNLTPQRTGALNACIFVGMFLVGGRLCLQLTLLPLLRRQDWARPSHSRKPFFPPSELS